ncbi:MAG: hypothetical protein NC453_26030 [Muribaculum sp.]|nr:hypothetical protein [Muribaculum sp.]
MKDDSKKDNVLKGGENGKEPNPLFAGTYYVTSARIEACKGKKYGDYCEWVDDDGHLQTGKCVYDKWGWTPGPLFCARADYKKEDDAPKDMDKEEV